MEITLIRHTAVDVPKGVLYGQTDVPLKETFPQEAQKVKEQIENEHFDAVFCSPLTRCKRLADYCQMKNIQYDDRLKEMNFGEWEMKHYEHMADPEFQQWCQQYILTPTKGGESFKMVAERFADFLKDLKGKDYEKVVIFTHGGIIMNAMIQVDKMDWREVFNHQPPYGGIVKFNI